MRVWPNLSFSKSPNLNNKGSANQKKPNKKKIGTNLRGVGVPPIIPKKEWAFFCFQNVLKFFVKFIHSPLNTKKNSPPPGGCWNGWIDIAQKLQPTVLANHSFWSYTCGHQKTNNQPQEFLTNPPPNKKVNNFLSCTPPNKQKKQSIQPNQASKITNQTPNNNHPVFRWEMGKKTAHVSKASRETCAMCHSLGALDFLWSPRGVQFFVVISWCFFLWLHVLKGIYIYK